MKRYCKDGHVKVSYEHYYLVVDTGKSCCLSVTADSHEVTSDDCLLTYEVVDEHDGNDPDKNYGDTAIHSELECKKSDDTCLEDTLGMYISHRLCLIALLELGISGSVVIDYYENDSRYTYCEARDIEDA